MGKEEYKIEAEHLRGLLKKALAKIQRRDTLINKIQIMYSNDSEIQSLIWEMEYEDDNAI